MQGKNSFYMILENLIYKFVEIIVFGYRYSFLNKNEQIKDMYY